MNRRRRRSFDPQVGLTLSRRGLLQGAIAGMASASWLPALAADQIDSPQRKRSCILLWMSGGPSQIDTFDPHPDHRNGGGVAAIDTAVPGIHISENLPQVATWMKRMAIVRSMSTKEGDHSRGTYLMRTGYRPQGPIRYPSIGALYSHAMASDECELPGFVAVGSAPVLNQAAWGAGFLGPKYAPLMVGGNRSFGSDAGQFASLQVENLALPRNVDSGRLNQRLEVLQAMEQQFAGGRSGLAVSGHQAAYADAVKMMRSEAATAFDLEDEPEELREKYGRSQFGQGCLLARRLVERGVPFIEVTLNRVSGQNNVFGWDTHQDNNTAVSALCDVLDPAWATLMEDLESRGLLDTTTIVWMGEFGRTPRINGNAGRDHFPAAWSAVLAGGGVNGGQVIGKTSDDGMRVVDRPVNVQDLLATVCGCLGIDGEAENLSNVGRPIRVVDSSASPISEVIA